jgi:4-hydroxy-tetrahydrodipicolinate synthase
VIDPSGWRGIFPSLVTPFHADGSLDLDGAQRLARFAVGCGAHGLLCFGLAGEVWKLTVSDRRALAREILIGAASIPVLVGGGFETVRESVAWASEAETLGAGGIVVPPPTASRCGEDGLVDYFAAVAAAVSVPVMIQNAPAYLGVALTPETVKRVRDRAENVRYVKLEAGPDELGGWVRALGDSFAVFGGDGGLYLVDSVSVGAAGLAPGVELTDRLVAVWETLAGGDRDDATRQLGALLPLIALEMTSIETYVACAKHVLAHRGVITHPHRRAPAASVGMATLQLVDAHLRRLAIARAAPG